MNVFCSVFNEKKISIRITISETTVNNAITISINSSLKFSILLGLIYMSLIVENKSLLKLINKTS